MGAKVPVPPPTPRPWREVYHPGAEVLIGGSVPAVVTAVMIRAGHTSYEVAWWDGRTRKNEWLQSFELVPKSADQQVRIGFLP